MDRRYGSSGRASGDWKHGSGRFLGTLQPGEQLLASASRHWADLVRRRDAIGRIGEDEFLFIPPGTSADEADEMVRRFGDTSPGAWSAGVATADSGETVESILDRADQVDVRPEGCAPVNLTGNAECDVPRVWAPPDGRICRQRHARASNSGDGSTRAHRLDQIGAGAGT